jgi:hypothetical protein
MAYVTMYVMIFFRGEVRSSPISISSTEKLFIVQYIIEIKRFVLDYPTWMYVTLFLLSMLPKPKFQMVTRPAHSC